MYRVNTHNLTDEERTKCRFSDSFTVTNYPDIVAQIGICRNGKIHAMAYSRKKLSPDWNYTFRNDDHLNQYIEKYIDGKKKHIAYKAEYKANRTPSNQAQAAALIRQELKQAFPGITFTVRSDSFAGGDSVDIDWTDGPTSSDVEKITDKYQYGHFDGMQDLYEYSNKRTDIPQAKYVMTQRTLSDKARTEAKVDIEKKFGISELTDATAQEIFHEWANTVIYRELVNKTL